MNPGLAQILSVVATAGMGRVDHITVLETVDVSCHHSVDTWKNVGYGRPVDDPEVPGLLETGCTVFADSIYLMADCLDLEIDDIEFECELGACTEDIDLGWWTLPKGSVGASLAKFKGISGGEPKIEVHLEWQMTDKTEPRWDVQGCYITTIEGDPTIVNRHMIFPATGRPHGSWTPEYFASLGMTITGMPALNAMRSVCEAKPGLLTSADLPLRAFAGRFHSQPTPAPQPQNKTMTSRYPFPASPNGWFSVAAGADLAPGDVLPLAYLGQDLVLFRGEDGVPRVFDAHCPHLGAHLGVGGRVCGDGIACPVPRVALRRRRPAGRGTRAGSTPRASARGVARVRAERPHLRLAPRRRRPSGLRGDRLPTGRSRAGRRGGPTPTGCGSTSRT